jgi:hypothetical protein
MPGRIGTAGLFSGAASYGWLRACFDIPDNMCSIVPLRFLMSPLPVWPHDVHRLLVSKLSKMAKPCKKLPEIKVDEEHTGSVLNTMVYSGLVSLFGA